MNKITLLGTGTNTIQKDRMASSVLIQSGDQNIVFDMGRGITQRLLEINIKQNDVEHMIISHFHPDHVSDLIPYIHAGLWSISDKRTKDLIIHAPIGGKELIEDIIIDKLIPSYHMKDDFKVMVEEIEGKSFFIGKMKFDVTILQPANNHAINFTLGEKKVGLSGDFDFSEDAIDFLNGLDFAVIDAGHSSQEQVIELAVQSQVKKIIMSHLYRDDDVKMMNKKANKARYKGELIKGEDLMSFNF